MASPLGKVGNKIPSGYKQGQIQNFTPEQMQILKQLGQRLGPDNWLSRLAGGDESEFEQLEAPALKQFAGLQGNIASRFSGMGQGAQNSSGFRNSMNQASSDFASQLQSQRLGLKNQAMKDLMGYSNQFLQQKPYETFLYEKEKSPWASMAGSLFGPLAGYAGDRFSGDKSYSGTQSGVNSFADMAKTIFGGIL